MWSGKSKPDFDDETQVLFDRLDELIEKNSLVDIASFELYPGRLITDPGNYAKTLRSLV